MPLDKREAEEGKIGVSVDIEDWYHKPWVTGTSHAEFGSVDQFFKQWDRRYDYISEPVNCILELFDELDIEATFFVVADVVDHYSGLVERIASEGHEIGCHGLHHECVLDPDTREERFTEEEYYDQLQEAKTKLEDASGQDIFGFRAPNAYITEWVPNVLEDVGFEYDSSVTSNSLYNKTNCTLDGVTSQPYIPQQDSLSPSGDRSLLEIPWPYYELAGYRLPTAGGPLLRLFGKMITKRGLKQSLKRGDTIFYFHPLELSNEDLPEFKDHRRRPMFWLFKGSVTEYRVKSLLSDFPTQQLTTCGEIAQRNRNQNDDLKHISYRGKS